MLYSDNLGKVFPYLLWNEIAICRGNEGETSTTDSYIYYNYERNKPQKNIHIYMTNCPVKKYEYLLKL